MKNTNYMNISKEEILKDKKYLDNILIDEMRL